MMRMRMLVLTVMSLLVATGCTFNGAYDLPLPGGPVGSGNSYEVTVDFADILNVVPKSPVMVDDVAVGEVTDVTRVGWHARVTLRIRDDIALPDNTTAQIRQVSLLGEKYVDLEKPTGGQAVGTLGDGDRIPLDRTGRNPEVEEVLGALSMLLSGGGVEQLATITHELNAALDGRTAKVRDLLTSLDGVVGTLDNQKRDIIHALQSVDDLTATLNRERTTIQGALDVAGPAISVLDQQENALVRMLSSLHRLGQVGTHVIRASKDDILGQLRDLRPVVHELSRAGESLAPGLNLLVSFPFPKEASEIVQGDYANTSIKADISLENLAPPSGPGLPSIPGLPGLPGLTSIQHCIESGGIGSRACATVLSSLDLLPQLVRTCQERSHRHDQVCQAVGLLGNGGGNGGGSGGGGNGGSGGGGTLPGLPDLPGLPGAARLTTALTSGDAEPRADQRGLFAGGR